MILGTVMLGYHNIVDGPAGALLALCVYYAEFRSPLIDRSGPLRSAS
jgi:hypothetical protein